MAARFSPAAAILNFTHKRSGRFQQAHHQSVEIVVGVIMLHC